MPVSDNRPVSDNLAIYVHWPFCLSKCPYCDFNSHVRETIDEEAFADALCRELDHYRALSGPRTIRSLFFGGGTPSLMKPDTVEAVLNNIARNWTMGKDVEITLEANPNSVEADRFRDFSRAGINRLSLGVQALNDKDLRALGRGHTAVEALKAIEISQTYFPRSSFDLIYARMGQSLADWEGELTRALDLAGAHLSLYQLTIEQGTAFYQDHKKGRLILPDEDIAADLYGLTGQICAANNMPAYEVSNHAHSGDESRHNLSYWQYDNYIGVGPGAHGRLDIDGQRHALCQTRSPEKWLSQVAERGHATDEKTVLSPQIMAEEMIMMGLRLARGIDLNAFENIVGWPIDDFTDPAQINDLVRQGYMERDARHLRALAQGMPLLNSLLSRILA